MITHILHNGLKVIAVQRASVPCTEWRLRLPVRDAPVAAAHLAAELLTSALAPVSASISVRVNADRIVIASACLTERFAYYLREVVRTVAIPLTAHGSLEPARAALTSRLKAAERRPDEVGSRALLNLYFRGHPYAQGAIVEDVAAVDAADLIAFQQRWLDPAGSCLVAVSSQPPAELLAEVTRGASSWQCGYRQRPPGTAFEGPSTAGQTERIQRPGFTRSYVRAAAAALARSDDDYAALYLASIILGGPAHSRLGRALRQDRGWSYAVAATLDHRAAHSAIRISFDVPAEHTQASLDVLADSVSRLGEAAPPHEELEAVRRFAIGSARMSLGSQASLADLCSSLAAADLDLSHLDDFCDRAAEVKPADIRRASATHLARAKLVVAVVTG